MLILITLEIIHEACVEHKGHAASRYVYNHIFVTVEQKQAFTYFLVNSYLGHFCRTFNV